MSLKQLSKNYTASDVKTRNGYLFIKSKSNFGNLNQFKNEISVLENNKNDDNDY